MEADMIANVVSTGGSAVISVLLIHIITKSMPKQQAEHRSEVNRLNASWAERLDLAQKRFESQVTDLMTRYEKLFADDRALHKLVQEQTQSQSEELMTEIRLMYSRQDRLIDIIIGLSGGTLRDQLKLRQQLEIDK